MFKRLIAFVVLIGALMIYAPTTTLAALPANFVITTYAQGLNSPTAMAFSPDGYLFVLEQGGAARVIQNGTLLATPFVSLTVNSEGERGLLGIAFDPNYGSNHYVYLYYTATTPNIHNRVSRFTASANGRTAVAGSEQIILDLNPLSGATNHNGGALSFGLDGKLYIAVGENANTAHAQSLGNLLGKILRINADGTVPTDNPFYSVSGVTGINKAIWAYGLRNPFTFAIQPGTGRMYVNDVGAGTWEEINLGVAGANYGWPATEGYTANPSFVSPVYAYDHGGADPNGCAIIGGAFYNPTVAQFPADYVGKYFFADFCGDWLRILDPNTVGVTVFGTGLPGSPADMDVGSDGSLYYLTRTGGSGGSGLVSRISYTTSPTPSITQHPSNLTVTEGVPATFICSAIGPSTLNYQWQRNTTNIPGATSPNYTLTPTVLGDTGANFRCVVSNGAGSATSNTATLTVTTNQPPVASITSPVVNAYYSGGESMSFAGTGTDPEDGTLPASAFSWRVAFHHDTHNHPFLESNAIGHVTSGTFTIPNMGETSTNVWYRVYLTMTDSLGRTHETFRDILPRTSVMSFTTNPPNLQITIDGQPATTPISITSVVGIQRQIGVVQPQIVGSIPYEFGSWSDSGAATHTITTPVTDTAYAATLVQQVRPTQIAPNGTVNADFGNPAFVWTDVPGATYYYVYVGVNPGDAQIVNEVVADAGYCAGGYCQIDLTTLRETYRLTEGNYRWYVRTWNPTDGSGQWVGPMAFFVNANLPGVPTLELPTNTDTLRPTLHWNLNSAGTATYTHVYVAPQSNLGMPVIDAWYPRAQTCGDAPSFICQLTLPVDLMDGVAYNVYMQAYGPGGIGAWSSPQSLLPDAATPALPIGLTVDASTGRTVITWNDDPNALWFQVYIGSPSGVQYYLQWHQNTPALCNGTQCTLTPLLDLANGSYVVYMRAWGAGGYNTGGISGWGGPAVYTLSLPAPSIPTNLVNSSISSGHPTLSWTASAAATYYEVWLGTATQVRYNQWNRAEELGCLSGGTCTLTPPVDLGNGEYVWYVRAWGPGGYSTGGISGWAGPQTFTIGVALPVAAAPAVPNGSITIKNPVFTWPHVDGVEYYQIWLGPGALNATIHQQWYRASEAGCGDGTCELTIPGLTLANGAYAWYLQTYTPAGVGPWSAQQTFTVAVPRPAAPTLVDPADDAIINATNRPTFTWNPVQYGEYYQLEVKNGMGTVVFSQWYQAETVCTPQPNPTTCAARLPNPIAYGGYDWRIQSYSQGGYGDDTWSQSRGFLSLSINALPLMVQSDDAAVVQSGAWAAVADENAVGDDYLQSAGVAGDALTLIFDGTSVDIVYLAGPQVGTFTVEIDGVTLQTVNAYSAQAGYTQLVNVGGLVAGRHTLRIVGQGGTSVAIDAIVVDGQVVMGTVPTLTPAPEVTPLPTPEATEAVIVVPTLAPTQESTPVPEVTPEATQTAP